MCTNKLVKLKTSKEINVFYNQEFKDRVLNEDEKAVKLAKVDFWISKDCIRSMQ